MRTGTLVAALTLSGAAGGAAGALLVQGLSGPPAPARAGDSGSAARTARDPALERDIAALRARLDEMQASVAASVEDAAKIRTDLEEARKEAAAAREKAAALEAAGPAARAMPPGVFEASLGSPEGRMARLALAGDAAGLGERFRKAAELRQKSEEERWAAAREALGLSPWQEEELKAALKERNQAMKDSMKMETREVKGEDGTPTSSISFAMPDPEKMRESRKRYDDRVGAALGPDQSKKWRDEGYEQALGGGFGAAFVTTSAVIDGAAK